MAHTRLEVSKIPVGVITLGKLECIAHVVRGNLPLARNNTITVVLSFVLHRMLADVLLDKVDLTIGFEVTIDCELADFVTTATFDAVVPDIHVVEDHLSLVAVLHVNTSPPLVDTSHFETIRETLNVPATSDSLALQEAIVEDGMLSEVLLLEMSSAVLFYISLENEFADVIITLASEYLTWCCSELRPSHVMVLAILCVGALPDQVAVENIGVWGHLVGVRRDALRLRHDISSWGYVNPHHRGCRLHHHWLLLLHHHRLLLLHHHLLLLLHHLRLRLRSRSRRLVRFA